ncbi:MAG: hypothetical protein INH37_10085 [Myxococcaceae bacterium]|nr:hypothetical protein [Myxococcaceae bacterium]
MSSALLLMLAAQARAQTPPPLPSPEPAPPPTPAPAGSLPSYAQQCFGFPAGAYLLPVPRPGVVVSGGASTASPGGGARRAVGGSGGGSGGSGDGKALLVMAVLLAAVLPVVVYTLDDEAPPIVRQRWGCPSFQLDLLGGADSGVTLGGPSPFGQGRLTMAFDAVGGDVSFDLSPTAISQLATHLLVRLAPKAHVEGGLAMGYRRLVTAAGQVREGFDVGLPHRYAFWRDGLRTFGLELRPSLLLGPSGVDAALEGALIVPVSEWLHVRVGGRVFSFADAIVFGGTAGVSLGL